MKDMHSRQDVDDALGQDTAILFKHSTRCPISAAARGEMERFMELHPDSPVYTVDVNDDVDASQYLAQKTGIEHHSPQVIVARGGEAEWHANHFDIRAGELERRVGSAKVRECGSAGVRECGSAGVRECGSAGVREGDEPGMSGRQAG